MEIEILAEAERIKDQITFAGFQKDVVPWLQARDGFSIPTSFDESVPQVVLQAMLCRLHVVTTPIGSIPDAIEHMETGLRVEPGKPTALAEGIKKIVNDPTTPLSHLFAESACIYFHLARNLSRGFLLLNQ